jgi:hypothetical protein
MPATLAHGRRAEGQVRAGAYPWAGCYVLTSVQFGAMRKMANEGGAHRRA